MKKILALVLALMMVLGCVAAFADPYAGVEGAAYDAAYFVVQDTEVSLVGHTLKAAQILKATEYTDKKYTNLTWGAQISDNGAALLTALKGDNTLKNDFTKFVTSDSEVTNDNPKFTAASFANAISNYTTDKAKALAQVLKGLYGNSGQGITITENMTPVELEAGIGYYLIDDVTDVNGEEMDAANPVTLFATPGNNTIKIKVDVPSQDKEVKENEDDEWREIADYNIGDDVPFQITSKVPNMENYTVYDIKFTDTMSDGLDFVTTGDNALKVTIGGTEVADSAYTLTPNADKHGFTLEMNLKANGTAKYEAGAVIVVSFYGTLNKSAEIGTDGETNTSSLEFSNNPDDTDSKGKTPDDKVIVFTFELDVKKIDGASQAALPGAQFALKATDGDHNGKFVIVDANGKVSGWADAQPEADAEPEDGLTSVLTSGADGYFKILGLDDGTYSLIEIKAPDGYKAIDPIAIEITATTEDSKDFTDELQEAADKALTKLEIDVDGEKADGDIETGIVEATVINNSGATLPETGGIGTTIFYVAGSILVLAAAILLVTKRRMSAND